MDSMELNIVLSGRLEIKINSKPPVTYAELQSTVWRLKMSVTTSFSHRIHKFSKERKESSLFTVSFLSQIDGVKLLARMSFGQRSSKV